MTDTRTNINSDLAAILAASSYADMRETTRTILEGNPMVRRLTRAVMAALVGCHWLDEHEVGNAFTEIMGHVKDAIVENIGTIALQDLAAIEHAARTWRPGAAEDASPDAQAERMARNRHVLKGLIDALDASEGDLMDALRRYVLGHEAGAAAPLSLAEKYGLATGRAVMANEALAALLDEDERQMIAHHRAQRAYENVSKGLAPEGMPDADTPAE